MGVVHSKVMFTSTDENLIAQLRQLSNAARQLGSSVGILSASFRLCERLSRVLFLFRENAVALFPNKVFRKGQVDRLWNFKRQRPNRRRNRLLILVSRYSTSLDRPTVDHLPDELHALAKDIATILDCFAQYPEFVDEVPEQSLEKDLEVSSLGELLHDVLNFGIYRAGLTIWRISLVS